MSLLPYARTVGDSTLPYWHRSEPQLTAFHLDPSYTRLKEEFPQTWTNLVKAKSYLDALALSDSHEGFGTEQHAEYTRELTGRVAREFEEIASAERQPGGRPALAAAAAEAGRLFTAYAQTGEWATHTVHEPVQGEPWLYCGPLNTWGSRTTKVPVGLLIAVEDLDLQVHIDAVDAEFETVTATVAAAHGVAPVFIDARPAMRTMDLLLGGGETSFGHKNFAHFFPLESPEGQVAGDDFTVVFTNVHRARIERCSLPLFEAALGDRAIEPVPSVDRLLAASLAWFRCHDFGHFWRASRDAGKTWVGDNGLTPFECMSLEETYADTLGLLCAARLVDGGDLSAAYNVELIRYLSRDSRRFADTVAATVGIGWLAEAGIELPASLPLWLDKGADALAELARTLHRVLWVEGASAQDVARLAAASTAGREVARTYEDLFSAIPTDLVFIQG
ncbi:hypothetical protein GCM10010302_02510 [Streptomyces polychromogenes]|uniref:Uncharacterized protein n=1 Tax=Streptomyces polychromogenes TaxID=67342 RepID=A0ABN0V086_9ACTN